MALNAIALGGTMCFTTGLMGYLSFRDATESDILDNFSGTFASLFKAFVVIHLILYIPSEASYAVNGSSLVPCFPPSRRG